MANHKSALKRARQDAKRRQRNRAVKSRIKGVVKAARAETAAGGEALPEKLRAAESELRKAASKGVIPKRRASRHVSRLARAAARAQS